MSDTSLNKFLGQGDDAVEGAFTPDPPTVASGPDPLVLFLNTESTPVLKYWDGDSFEDIGGGGAGTVTNTGTLTSGKTIIGNGTVDVTVSSLTAQFVGSSSGAAAAASMSTARLLGRTTASSGAVEEITVGSGLSLAAGSLTATGSGGAVVLLEQHTASASATLDFTTFISASYDTYLFVLVNVLPATSTDDLWVRMGTGGGPSWDSGANYTWAYAQDSQLPNAANLGAAGETKIKIAHSLSNTSTNGISSTLHLFDPESTTSHKLLTSHGTDVDSAGNFINANSAGRYLSTTAVTGVQFLFSSGNITSGTIRVYGLEK